MDRRKFITRGTAMTVGVWAVPSIRSVALAQTAPGTPRPATCSASSFDIRAVFTGPVSGDAGPVRQFPPDNDCFSDLAVTAPGQTQPFATASTFCVGGGEANGVCSAFAQIESANVDLTNVDPLLNVQLTADVLRAEISCNGAAMPASTITNLQVSVGGVPLAVPVDPPPNTIIPINVPGVATGQLVLNEQFTDADGVSHVNAVHLTVAQPLTGQTVDLIIASASCDPDPGP